MKPNNIFWKRHNDETIVVVSTPDNKMPDSEWNRPSACKSLLEAVELAMTCTESFGEQYIGVDEGPNVLPRFGIDKLITVGEIVSYGFNGDYYPCGTVTKISKTFRKIETSDGSVFHRRKNTNGWFKDGTWCLVVGYYNERNPSF